MREIVADIELGGGGSEGVREFFQGGDPYVVVVRGRDVGTDPEDGAAPD